MRRAYNFDLQLYQFFDDPRSFRIMQSYTGAIVCGDAAFRFFTRTDLEPQDDVLQLEIAVEQQHIFATCKWLRQNGYTSDEIRTYPEFHYEYLIEGFLENHPWYIDSDGQFLGFNRVLNLNGDERRVNITVLGRCRPITFILEAKSSKCILPHIRNLLSCLYSVSYELHHL